jgi:hypothetical protein
MINRNPYILVVCTLMILVFGYCFWVAAAQ